MYPHIGNILGGFHHWVEHRLTGWKLKRRLDWALEYPPPEEATDEAGIQEVETYVACHHNKVTQVIATRPIMDLCLEAEWTPGAMV